MIEVGTSNGQDGRQDCPKWCLAGNLDSIQGAMLGNFGSLWGYLRLQGRSLKSNNWNVSVRFFVLGGSVRKLLGLCSTFLLDFSFLRGLGCTPLPRNKVWSRLRKLFAESQDTFNNGLMALCLIG